MIDNIVSPGHSYKIVFSCYEVRMSHWIEQPHLIRVSDSKIVFSLNGASWSAFKVQWHDDETVFMRVSKYPGRISLDITLNVNRDAGSAVGEFKSFSGTLSQVSNWILAL
ncbi:hypothetical protein ACFSUS_27190 [Spirosoma soli]|uniref:Uncharacterized protein n=1 Tax=Spirosoma soli TaxID=1770529 RepID=A0ABW5MBG7_9BACT